ncbi:MAG: DNA ligase D [Acidobacteriota bacterium]
MFDARTLRPMLAVLPDRPPPLSGKGLVYEPKYDGIRAIVFIEPIAGAPRVRFWSRNGNEKTAQFPEVVEGLARWGRGLRGPVVLDGEIVALDPKGRPAGFQRLQSRINLHVPGHRRSAPQLRPDEQPAAFIAFDLLRDGDDDLRRLPLTERRARLQRLFARHKPGAAGPRLAEQMAGDGSALYARAEREGWEGLVVKTARSPYRDGRRSPEWQKLKILQTEEFVIGGWTEPRGTRARFGALVLGVFDGSTLRHVGDVGTGFTAAELDRLWTLLAPLETTACPFDPPPKTKDRVHWVQPRLVAQVRFAEWTDDRRLRHPTYLGLRDDKPARAVTRARAGRDATEPGGPPGTDSDEAAAIVGQLDALEARKKDGRLTLPGGDTLDVTNLAKVFWPGPALTKGDLLRYYTRVAPYILPVLDERPLVMKRMPNGVEGKAFYQHRAPDPIPPGIRIETLPDDDVPARLVGGSLKTLLYMAQLASISMDPWFSRLSALDQPDQVAIDLDPGDGATFSQILDVARWVHDELHTLGVTGYPKTSGSEGLHIYIPLQPGTSYEAGMLFCQIVATMVATRHPKVATVERMVKKRRPGTVYVDYLQNIRGKTLACAYSARASAFAGVSAPLTWDEVYGKLRPEDFTMQTMMGRLAQVGDLWAPLRRDEGADLIGALDRLQT